MIMLSTCINICLYFFMYRIFLESNAPQMCVIWCIVNELAQLLFCVDAPLSQYATSVVAIMRMINIRRGEKRKEMTSSIFG